MAICIVENCTGTRGRTVLCGKHLKLAKMGRLPITETMADSGVVANPACMVPKCETPRVYKKTESFCRNHYETDRKGLSPEEVRPKIKNDVMPDICIIPDCSRKAASKNMCTTHYSRSRAGEKKRTPCIHKGCNTVTRDLRCTKHTNQWNEFGFTWSGKIPDKARRIRRAVAEKNLPVCAIGNCAKKASTGKSRLCQRHNSERSSKGLTVEQLVKIKSITACQACGSTRNLHTDHDHSCPFHKSVRMCPMCIRGILCNGCNSALGHVLESADTLRALITFIEGKPLLFR